LTRVSFRTSFMKTEEVKVEARFSRRDGDLLFDDEW
jgi:hypothetical protein